MDKVWAADAVNQLKLLVFGNIKRVSRFAFIQANVLFLKLNRISTKIDISCVKS